MIGEMSLPSMALWERYPPELPYLLRWGLRTPYRPAGLALAPLYREERGAVTNLYFIQADAPRGPVKIGVAMRPMERLETLQVGCPYPLTLVAAVPGTVVIEHAIHEHLKEYRRVGEWFEPAPPVLEVAAEFFDIALMLEDFVRDGCELELADLAAIMWEQERAA